MKTSSSQDTTLPSQTLELKLAHSPDSDDAFMFYALATRKIPTGKLRFEHVLQDIETLNQKALDGVYDITAVSFHGYAYLADRYLLLDRIATGVAHQVIAGPMSRSIGA